MTELTFHNSIRERMLRNEVVYTLSVRLVRTVELSMMATTAEFDGILIDMKHSTADLDTTILLYAGIYPIVRVPSKDPLFVSRELNGGGMRVIVIYIRPVQDAKDVIAAANFQLLGHRSLTNDMPQFQYHHLSANAMNVVCNRVTLVISMMETFEAVDCVEELAAVENVDSLLIGTNNMCAKLGIQCEYKNPRLTKVHEKAIAACKKHSKRVGVGWLHSRLDIVERFCATGARWVTAVTDGPLLLGGATKRAHEMAHLSARVKELKQQKLMSGGATDE